MSYSFHPEVEREFLEAIDYYKECEANLGFDFAVEVYAAIGRAVEHPKAHRSTSFTANHHQISNNWLEKFPGDKISLLCFRVRTPSTFQKIPHIY